MCFKTGLTSSFPVAEAKVERSCLLGCAGLGQSEGLAARRATEMMTETPWSVFQSFRALMVNVFQDGTDQLHLRGTEAMVECGCLLGCAGLGWSVFQSFRALMVHVFQDGTDQLHLWGTEAMVECGCLLGCAGLGQSEGLAARRATEMMTETPWSVFQSFRALMVNVFQDGTDQLHLWGGEAMPCDCLLGCVGLGQSEGPAARRATEMMTETPWSVFQSFRALMVNVFQDGTDQLHLRGTEVECVCLLGCATLGQSQSN